MSEQEDLNVRLVAVQARSASALLGAQRALARGQAALASCASTTKTQSLPAELPLVVLYRQRAAEREQAQISRQLELTRQLGWHDDAGDT